MNSRERVRSAVNHVRPDRIPINFRAVDLICERMTKRYGADYENLLTTLNVDFREITPPCSASSFGVSPTGSALDCWGVGRKEVVTATSRDVFVDYNPLAGVDDIDDVLKHAWPSPDIFDYSTIAAQCVVHDGKALCTPGIHAEGYHGVFHILSYLFGMEDAMMNLLAEEELMQAAVGRIMEFMLGYYERLFEAGKGKIDLVFYKDDYGTQSSLLISRDLFTRFFKPCIRKLTDLAHHYDAYFIMHSCGAVKELIPDFIDAGVDILDPIQTSATGMVIEDLKREFDDRLCFHGAIDTQQFLPNATADEVVEMVKRTISVLGHDGGYLFSSSHRIQQDTPLENIIAMYDTANSFTAY